MVIKTIRVLWAYLFMLMQIPVQLYAADVPTESWSQYGNYSISWYNKNKEEFILTTAKELAGMAYLINNGYTDFKGKTIKIGSDIDLGGKLWIPCDVFKGTIDGQGHTISNIIIFADGDLGQQQEFGFFKILEDASMSNLVFEGEISVNISEESNKLTQLDTFLGFIAGRATGYVTIEKCDVKADISFSRAYVGSNTSEIDNAVWSCIGGFVGFISSGATISYCKHVGDIVCNVPSIYPIKEFYIQCVAIGGIAGVGAGQIQYSENISSEIRLVDNATTYVWRYIGGILGTGSKSNKYGAQNLSILCCRSIINKISMVQRKNPSDPRTVGYNVGGIVPKRSHGSYANNYHYVTTNCYSIIKELEIGSMNPYTWFLYGGIGGDGTQSMANFSNNDVQVTTEIAGSIAHIEHLYDGSTDYSSNQMLTPAFLEELNMYSMLEMDDGPVWTQDKEGGYPYIAKLYQTAGVKTMLADGNRNSSSVYSLSGQRLAAPRKGVNIVGGRKVVVK